ncbi:sporulation protein YqfD [Alkalihalobacillus sp. AL-G]|uniref:sporulation protein YqfD n=1 Tax=Alkalihalobacillus sp. AL-G TaxID=2926399 RepID=UPI00272CF730|nr:sporulation protein YqfD [Alkalihalobacillus sp. AL-G]WLD92123.1 sporulation protein YqfD [Alkalihalobacillus sp. AL-G]
MKKNWTKYLYGTVIILVEGKHAERFLNYCLHNGIQLWDIKRKKDNELELNMFLEDALRIKTGLRKSGCTFKVLKKKGIPFLLKQIISRSGFVLGIGLFLVIVFLLSNMVWNIQITGAQPKTEHHLRKIIDELGIEKGKLLFMLPDVRSVQHLVTEKMDEVTWVGVTLEGTTFHFRVVEKELPEEVETLSPQNLVAKKEAVITKMYVEKGQPKVEVNQTVNEGDLLVSGYIGKDKNTKTVAAKGKVYGEVWYVTDTTVSLTSKYNTYTGERTTKHYVSLFGWRIPIWGFDSIEYKLYEPLIETKTFRFLKWELPVYYIQKDILEAEKVTRSYSEADAVSIAKEMAKEDLENKLDDDAEIKSGKILHHTLDNGKVNVSMHFTVIENIATEQPIVGGD